MEAAGPCTGGPPRPSYYCTAKTTSLGCVPFLTADQGLPSVSSTVPWNVRSNDHEPANAGFLIYASKKASLDFHGGKLCVKPPFVRTPVAKSKSTTCVNPMGTCLVPTCRQLRRNFNATIQSGSNPLLTAGALVRAQMFQRDPADPLGFGDNLSNGVVFVITP
jgi:hypothetical protein